MDLKIEIDKDAVQNQLVQAITESAIGEEIQKAISSALTEKTGPYENRKTLIESAVHEALKNQIRQLISAQLLEKREVIASQLSKLITEDAISKLSDGMWDFAMNKLNDR